MGFRDFVNNIEEVAKLLAESKNWKGKKPEILSAWKQLPSNLPLAMEPISSMQRGTRYRSDGIRLTGNSSFINAMLSRLKELINYESPQTELDIRYEEIPRRDVREAKKFVVYLNVIDKNLIHYKKELEKQKRAR